jgi:hypothetical protein
MFLLFIEKDIKYSIKSIIVLILIRRNSRIRMTINFNVETLNVFNIILTM